MPHPVVFSKALEKKIEPKEMGRGKTAVETLLKMRETPVSNSGHISLGYLKEKLIDSTLLLCPEANIRSDGGKRTMRERKIILATGIVASSSGAAELFKGPIKDSNGSVEVMLGVSKHSLKPYESPALLLPVDEGGHAYEGITYKVAFSANTNAGGIASFDTSLSPSTLHTVNGAALLGRTAVAVLALGEQNPHNMPYVLVFEEGRSFKEIENYAKPWLTDHPNILLVTFGLFSNVVLQKQEPNKHVIIRHGQKHETEIVATTHLKASEPVPGVAITDLRMKANGPSWSTYAAFDNNGIMQGGAVLSAKIAGPNAFGMAYFG